MLTLKGKYTTATITSALVEYSTINVVKTLTNNLAFTQPIAIMPDGHYCDATSCVGFTMPFSDKIIPSIIGYDINCGVLTCFLDNWHSGQGSDPRNLEIDRKVREVIPFGQHIHETSIFDFRNFPWKDVNREAAKLSTQLNARYNSKFVAPCFDSDWLKHKCREIRLSEEVLARSLGTMGGGNHFMSFDRSKATGQTSLTIHTGSRNFGKRICEYWQAQATKGAPDFSTAEWISRVKRTYPKSQWKTQIKRYNSVAYTQTLQARGLEYLENEQMFGYLCDMIFVQEYARVNRKLIAERVAAVLELKILDRIESEHNYLDFTDWVIRKGAIRAHKGERLVIPLTWSDGILVCEGKGNADWNNSAPHGAGRLYSRRKIKELFSDGLLTQEEIEAPGAGIYTAGIPVDESQQAYKPADLICEAIAPTATIIDQLVPFINLKALDGAKPINCCL
jgi:RNA-splicing ligase RtcB